MAWQIDIQCLGCQMLSLPTSPKVGFGPPTTAPVRVTWKLSVNMKRFKTSTRNFWKGHKTSAHSRAKRSLKPKGPKVSGKTFASSALAVRPDDREVLGHAACNGSFAVLLPNQSRPASWRRTSWDCAHFNIELKHILLISLPWVIRLELHLRPHQLAILR